MIQVVTLQWAFFAMMAFIHVYRINVAFQYVRSRSDGLRRTSVGRRQTSSGRATYERLPDV